MKASEPNDFTNTVSVLFAMVGVVHTMHTMEGGNNTSDVSFMFLVHRLVTVGERSWFKETSR